MDTSMPSRTEVESLAQSGPTQAVQNRERIRMQFSAQPKKPNPFTLSALFPNSFLVTVTQN